MPYLPEFLTVALVHFLVLISPGPDFVLVSRNSLIHSRRTGIYTTIGVALGIMVHVTYSLVGIGLIISRSVLLFSIIKFLGAGYLIYVGYRSLRAQPHDPKLAETPQEKNLTGMAAFRNGFFTNILNPKVTLFFLALFTQIISPATPKFIQVLYGLEMGAATLLWFSLVAIFLSHRTIKTKFQAIQHYIERTCGVVLIALGVKVALSSSK